jgi:hypothetical protein
MPPPVAESELASRYREWSRLGLARSDSRPTNLTPATMRARHQTTAKKADPTSPLGNDRLKSPCLNCAGRVVRDVSGTPR